MKKNYILLLLTILFSGITIAQETQKNFINYQGVARNASNELMAGEAMAIGVALKFGTVSASSVYEESHLITTDANGVFSLLIGNGSHVNGDYNSLPWGSAATFVTVSMNGNELGTTEMMAVPYAISSGDADDQSAAEVLYDNSASGLSATTAQEAIDELITEGSVDADSDPENEFQSLSFDVATNLLSLSDGNSITIPSGGTDADADPTNEIQTISFDSGTNELSLTDGGIVTIPSGGPDADADPENEFQTLNFDVATNELSLSDGNTITIPSGGTDADADPENEIDVTRRHGLLIGDDGIVDGLVGTADGQVAKWDAALGNWVAGTDAIGAGGGGSATGFESLNEGSGIGWRLIGGNPANYGPIGLNALDASTNGTNSERGATGFSATALGEETIASGPRSIAAGYGSKASGSVSTAMGEETEASGEFAVAMGDRTIASEQSSTAFGSGTRATNTHATSMGESTIASGKSATSTGIGTQAESLGSFALGRNNIGGGDAHEWLPSDPLFEVGNGSETVPNNALTILKDGKIGVGTATPSAMLQVEGNIRSSDLSGSGQRNVLADADGNLVIGASGGGSSLWSDDADDIYFDTGKVGIGVSNPFGKLQISQDSGGYPFLVLETTSGNTSNLRFSKDGVNESWEQIATIVAGDEASNTFNYSFYDGGTAHNIMTLQGNRRIGVNNSNPQTELDVNGQIRSNDLSGGGNVVADVDGNLVIGASGGGSSLWSQEGSNINYTDGRVGIGLGSDSSDAALEVVGEHTSEGILNVKSSLSGRNLAIDDIGIQGRDDGINSILLLNKAGGRVEIGNEETMVGIGMTGFSVAESTLDVNGDIRSRNLSGTGQRNIMADADGNLVVGSGGSSLWTEDLEGINYSSGNIGIGGDSSQFYPLHINTASDRSINLRSSNADNYIAFSNSDGYKGYMGIISGDNDIDIGTGLFNTTGKVHLTTGTFPKLTVVADGDVGIGTTTPSAKLDVEGDIRSGELTGVGERNVMADANGNLVIGSGGGISSWTENGNKIHYNAGNVGLGETDPTGKLHITKGYSTAPFLNLESAAGDRSDIRFSKSGSTFFWDQVAGVRTDAASGSMSYYYNEPGTSNHIMSLRGDGRMGINTPHPEAALDVDGDARIRDLAGSGQRNVMADADGNLVIGAGGGTGGGATRINDLEDGKSDADGSSIFIGEEAGQNDDGSENGNTGLGNGALGRNISGSGDVALGSSAAWGNTTGDDNTAVGRGALFNNRTGSYNTALGRGALFATNGGDNNIGIGNFVDVPNSAGSNQVRIGNDLVTYAGIQVPWMITSDVRWKENVQNLPYGLNMVTQLRPVDYVRKNNDKKTREIGFIAQEVEQLLQELGYENQGILTKDDGGFMSLRYNDFIPVLTKAVQELKAENDALKTTLGFVQNNTATIQKELAELKAQIKIIAKNKTL